MSYAFGGEGGGRYDSINVGAGGRFRNTLPPNVKYLSTLEGKPGLGGISQIFKGCEQYAQGKGGNNPGSLNEGGDSGLNDVNGKGFPGKIGAGGGGSCFGYGGNGGDGQIVLEYSDPE